jgi:MscS family membrane protein
MAAPMFDAVVDFLQLPASRAMVTLVLAVVVAFLGERFLTRVFGRLAARTETTLDDLLVASMRRPFFYTVILIGARWAMNIVTLSEGWERLLISILETLAAIIWAGALIRIGTALLHTMSTHATPTSVVQARTLPIFDILLKVVIFAGAIYAIMLAWQVDITAWLASAGVVGIAVGFAARDSLANLFAGIFIIADAPYKLGDYIQFEDGLRGRVTDIGIRSTRILTRDDIEINIPNSIIGNAKVVNETGGPYTRQRIGVPVSIAYGSDVERVREVLLATTADAPSVAAAPAPMIFFRGFGDSGLEFAVMVWLEDPALKDIVISEMNFRIYKALRAAQIEIPYSKHDVFVKELPAGFGRLLAAAATEATAPAQSDEASPPPG